MDASTRRQILTRAARAGAAVALLDPWTARAAGARSAVVVGAGLAGLTAADALRRAGVAVTVLEARDRVGGRVWTVRDGFDGQHAEAGGEFIDTGHRQMLALVRRFGLRVERVGKGDDNLDGVLLRRGRRTALEAAQTSVAGELDRLYARVETLAGRIEVGDPARGPGAALDRRTAAELLADLSPLARFLAAADLRDDFTVEPRRLSLLSLAWSYAVSESQSDSGIEAYRIRGGNDQVPAALARPLGTGLRTGAVVTDVTADGAGVRVRVAGGEEVAAERCVLALPPPALRRIAVTPALPAAATAVTLGVGTKVLLSYRARAWRADGESGDAFTDLPASTFYEATDQQRGRAGILIAYTAGTAGQAFTKLSPAARIAAANRDAARVFAGVQGTLRAAATAAWAADPLTGGTYSAFAPGELTRSWPALRGPFGRLHIAGEHTEPLSGYMESAVRSGLRAAREVLAA